MSHVETQSEVTAAERSATANAVRLVASVPHRFFFLIGVIQIVLISLWWAWALAARAWPALPAPAANDRRYVEGTRQLRQRLAERGYQEGASLMYVEETGATHHEDAWAGRLPAAFRFLSAS